MRKFIFMLIPAITLLSCFNSANENSLFGRYHFNTNRQDLILLEKNYTYSHRYVNSQGKIFEVHGKWRYNGKQISFYDFNFFNDLGTTGGDGIWSSEVTEDNGKIKLNYSSDDDTYFEKE